MLQTIFNDSQIHGPIEVGGRKIHVRQKVSCQGNAHTYAVQRNSKNGDFEDEWCYKQTWRRKLHGVHGTRHSPRGDAQVEQPSLEDSDATHFPKIYSMG